MFRIEGKISQIRMGSDTVSKRTDGLWKTTCFECFVREEGKESYREFNVAFDGGWAAYEFASYRDGMREADIVPPLSIRKKAEDWMTLESRFFHPIKFGPAMPTHWANLSAIIEETDGTKSYWALAHPPGKPDFHHPDCFVLELPPPNAA